MIAADKQEISTSASPAGFAAEASAAATVASAASLPQPGWRALPVALRAQAGFDRACPVHSVGSHQRPSLTYGRAHNVSVSSTLFAQAWCMRSTSVAEWLLLARNSRAANDGPGEGPNVAQRHHIRRMCLFSLIFLSRCMA